MGFRVVKIFLTSGDFQRSKVKPQNFWSRISRKRYEIERKYVRGREPIFTVPIGPDRWPVLREANSSKIDVMLLSIWFTKPSTLGAGSEKSVEDSIFCLKMSNLMFLMSRYWYVLLGGLGRTVLSLARTRQNFVRGLNQGWGNQFWRWWCNDEIEQEDLVMMCVISAWLVSWPVVWKMWSGAVVTVHRHKCLALFWED